MCYINGSDIICNFIIYELMLILVCINTVLLQYSEHSYGVRINNYNVVCDGLFYYFNEWFSEEYSWRLVKFWTKMLGYNIFSFDKGFSILKSVWVNRIKSYFDIFLNCYSIFQYGIWKCKLCFVS